MSGTAPPVGDPLLQSSAPPALQHGAGVDARRLEEALRAAGPALLFGLFAGSLADIIDRRKVIFATQILLLVASALLGIATLAVSLFPMLDVLAESPVGPTERAKRANWTASRRAVLTRSPAFLGISDGATTQQSSPLFWR